MFSLMYAWINDWVNNREAGDLRRQHGHYDVIVMNQIKSEPAANFEEIGPEEHLAILFFGPLDKSLFC